MGVFKTLVQKGKIIGPMRRQFNQSQWAKEHQNHGTDEEDKNLYDAGLEINRKADAIRAALTITNNSLSATTKLRAFVAFSNYNICVLKDKTEQLFEQYVRDKKAVDDGPLMMNELTAMKIRVFGDFEFSPDEITEVSVEGIETPIRVILSAQPSLAGNPQNANVNWGQVAAESNMGGLYSLLADLWDECLWNDYAMNSTKMQRVFAPRQPMNLMSKIASQTRASTIGVHFTAINSRIQEQNFQHQSTATALLADVTGIVKDGRKQRIKLSRNNESSIEHRQLVALRAMATEPYYQEMLQDSRPALAGATLQDLLSAWAVIARCGAIMLGSLRSRTFSKTDAPSTWLPEFAPTLQLEALTKAICTACDIDRSSAVRLIEFFTFRGADGQELWAQPLVPVNPDNVAPVIAALSSPNLRRLVDVWLRQAGLDLSLRGPAFEIYIRSSLRQAIEESPLLSKCARVYEKEFIFRPIGGREEEVDVVFSIGNTVFFCELKCILDPTDAKGVAMHRKTVHDAVKQIRRKVDSANSQINTLKEQLCAVGFEINREVVIHPLVVLSSPIHAGTEVDGVAVTDELILTRFFEGELIDLALQTAHGEMEVKKKTVFYLDEDQAEAVSAAYFSDPPQMRVYKEGMSQRWVPVHPVAETDWSALMMVFSCKPVTPALDGDELLHTAAK